MGWSGGEDAPNPPHIPVVISSPIDFNPANNPVYETLGCTGDMLGRSAPTMMDLECMIAKNGESFELLEKLADGWRHIGNHLGIDYKKLNAIASGQSQNEDRLREVFSVWLEEAEQLPHKEHYPLSWNGLRTLISNSKHPEVATDYFNFLENNSF